MEQLLQSLRDLLQIESDIYITNWTNGCLAVINCDSTYYSNSRVKLWQIAAVVTNKGRFIANQL